MPRARPPKDIVSRRNEQPKDKLPVESGRRSIRIRLIQVWKFGGKLAGWLLASLGFATAYLSLIPRISVSQNQPLDVDDPFSAPFVVSNDGPLGINGLQFSCRIYNIETKGSKISNIETSMLLGAKQMEPGERATVPCDTMPMVPPKGPLVSGDLAVVVSFRADFTWWRKSRAFRFVAQHTPDGRVYWYPQPFSGPVSSPVKGYPPR